MRPLNWIKAAAITLLAATTGIFWSCNVSDPETQTTLNLTLHDSLSFEAGIYDSVRVDILDGSDSVFKMGIFTGPYIVKRDSLYLTKLQLGANRPNPMKIRIVAYKNGVPALNVSIAVNGKIPAAPVNTILNPPDNPEVPAKIVLSDSALTLGVNALPHRIYATLNPAGTVGTVTFTSSHPDVAQVDQEGNISPLTPGQAIITASLAGNTKISSSVKVTVIVPPAITDIAITRPVATLYVGAPAKPLVLTHEPPDLALIPNFKSSDEGIIKVVNGGVLAVSEGNAIITVNPTGITGVEDTIHLKAVKDVPQIDAGVDQSVAVGQAVTFKIKVTQEFGTIAVNWDFNGDNVAEGTATTDTSTATYTFGLAGDYNVVFTAKDGEGNTSTLSRRIRVGKAGPLIIVTSPRRDTLVRTPKITVAYTVDGTPASKEYDLKEGLNLLLVTAINATGGDTVVVKVTLDTKAPLVKITSPAANLITNLPEILVVWSEDSVTQTTRNKEPLTGKQGAIWVIREKTDSAGNRGADSVQIVRDTIPPGSPTFVGGDTMTNNVRPTWAWKHSVGGSGAFTIQFGTGEEVTAPDSSYAPLTDLKDGQYTLRVRERDPAGNLSAWATRTITVKATGPGAPSFNANLTTASPTNIKRPTWAWISSGVIGGGSATFRWSVNTPVPASGEGIATQFIPTADLPDGTYTLTLQERDGLGNWSTPVTRDIRILTQGVLVEITSPARRSHTNVRNGIIQVAWSIEKVVQTTQLTQPLTTEGAWNLIRREFTDAAKNISFDTLSVFWDTTTPKVTFTSPANGAFFATTSVPVTWTEVGGTAQSNTETLAAGDGAKTITRTITDLAGNIGSASMQVVLDMTAPTATIDEAATRTTNVPALTLTGTASDATSGIKSVSISGAATGNGVATFNATAMTWNKGSLTLAEGANTLTVTATDNAGLTRTATVSINLDTKPPVILIKSPANGAIFGTTSVPVVWSVDGGADQSNSETLTGADGTKTITRTATDLAGNPGSGSVSITLDMTAPSVAIDGSATRLTNNSALTLTGTATDATSGIKSVVVSGAATGNGAAAYNATNRTWNKGSLTLANGLNTITVTGTDNTDRTSTATVRVTLDTQAPKISLIDDIPDGFVTNKQTLTVRYTVDGSARDTTFTLTNGSKLCKIRVADEAGNADSVSRTYWYRENVVFVNPNATGAGDGSSWEDAETDLYIVLSSSNYRNKEIWVSAGAFSRGNEGWGILSGMKVYGGFPATGHPNSLGARNPNANPTVLSGTNFTLNDFPTTTDVLMDGLELNKIYLRVEGGSSNFTLSNTKITGNDVNSSYGRIFIQGSDVTLDNVTMNITAIPENAIYIVSQGKVTIRGGSISSNSLGQFASAALYVLYGDVHLEGSLRIIGNTSVDESGAPKYLFPVSVSGGSGQTTNLIVGQNVDIPGGMGSIYVSTDGDGLPMACVDYKGDRNSACP